MDERQRQLIDYFNRLSAPLPPRRATSATLESASAVVAPPPASVATVRRVIERNATLLPPLLHGTNNRQVELGVRAAEKARADEPLTADELATLEAIVLPGLRPVLDVAGGSFGPPPPGWEFLDGYRDILEPLLPSVGRIDVPELLLTPYAGTGFFVGEGLLMTNRHVAVMFSDGVGAGPAFLRFKPNHTPRLSSRYEVGDLDQHSQEQPFEVVETLLIHPHWDIAVLRVAPLGNAALPPALRLADAPPPLFGGGAITHIAVVGYPMLDDRSNVPEQMRIFRQIFGRKRLMPGYLTGYADQISKWGTVQHAVTHDATTLGGNSGSAVIDLTTGLVLAIHFGGRYRVANFGVPAWELAQDPRIVALGVQFGSLDPPLADAQTIRVTSTPVPPLWLGAWEGLRPLGGIADSR